MGTWFMFVAQFNQLVRVTFRGFFSLFFRTEIDVGERLHWICCCHACDLLFLWYLIFPFYCLFFAVIRLAGRAEGCPAPFPFLEGEFW